MNVWIGTTPAGERLWLTGRDLEAHVHGVGVSRLGKSKLIEWIARELIKQQRGFCLVDPHGELYGALLRWLAHVEPKREIILLNPSYEQRVVGFNPFTIDDTTDETKLWTKVDRMVAATLRAWGQTQANNAPRLDRWLRTLYYTILEQGLSVDAARYFLSYEHKTIRDAIIRRIRAPLIREEWSNLLGAATKQGFVGKLESAGNRLQRFITHPTVRRTMGQTNSSIDLERIMKERAVLLVNLQPSDALSADAATVLGTLLLNEIWEVARRRSSASASRRPSDFYLVIDEFQNFATPDIPDMLDEGAKNGLHLMLFHQRLSQLTSDLQGAVRNAHTRFVFGGLPRTEVASLLEGSLLNAPTAQVADEIASAVLQPKQHFTFRRAGWPLATVRAPRVENFPTDADRVARYVERLLAEYPTPEAVDAMLAADLPAHVPESIPPENRVTPEPPRVFHQESAIRGRTTLPRRESGFAGVSPVDSDQVRTPTPMSSSTQDTVSPARPLLGRGGAQHKYLQQLVKRLAEAKGFTVTIEQPVLGGTGSVDVSLERDNQRIACEISVTSTPEYEVLNVMKCLASGYASVIILAPDQKTLHNIQRYAATRLDETARASVMFLIPAGFISYLEQIGTSEETGEDIIEGRRITVRRKALEPQDQQTRKRAIAGVIMRALKRLQKAE